MLPRLSKLTYRLLLTVATVIMTCSALLPVTKTAKADTMVAPPSSIVEIDTQQLQAIGQKIYRNETGGKPEHLIFWNAKEPFPSLGIGHFIWFKAGDSHRFIESFPDMIRFLKSNGADVPDWLSKQITIGALWGSREQLQQTRQDDKTQALQQLLIDTSGLQALYLFQRLNNALPKMVEGLVPEKRQWIIDRFNTVKASPNGLYPLVDYVNFKGEGTALSERYNGVGWGLRQVLELMEPTPIGGDALKAFATAADLALTRRAANAPVERNETRWLSGWRVRLKTYYQ